MPAAAEFADLGGGAYRWEAFDRASKVDLSASAVTVAGGGLVFVDPIGLARKAFQELLAAAGGKPCGVFVTNANHRRAADEFTRDLGVPLLDAAGAQALGLNVIPLPGAAPGETALHRPDGGGLMLVGDAVINLCSHPFSLLPDRYCDDPAELRRSLARLLDFPFERLLLAHGEPLMEGARARLAALLGLANAPPRSIDAA